MKKSFSSKNAGLVSESYDIFDISKFVADTLISKTSFFFAEAIPQTAFVYISSLKLEPILFIFFHELTTCYLKQNFFKMKKEKTTFEIKLPLKLRI